MWLAEKVRFLKHEQTTPQSPGGRSRAAYRAFIREEADIVFANEAEICALYDTEDFDAAAEAVPAEVAIAALTRSEKGSRIIAGTETHEVRAEPTKLVDSTGAGDAYAAGFMAALARGLALAECGRWGSIAAVEVISHLGGPRRIWQRWSAAGNFFWRLLPVGSACCL